LKLVLEPISEADLLPCSYGFRPGRRASMDNTVSPSTPAVLAPLLPRTRSHATNRNAGSATKLNRSSNLR